MKVNKGALIAKLKGARGRIVKGWCKGANWIASGREIHCLNGHHVDKVCLNGAIFMNHRNKVDGRFITEAAHAAVAKTLGHNRIDAFNDSPRTKKDDVLRVIDKTIYNIKHQKTFLANL